MSALPHVTSGLGLRKFQADGFLSDRVYLNYSQNVILKCLALLFYIQKVPGSVLSL